METSARGGQVSGKAEIGCGSLGGHFETGQEGRDRSGQVTVDRFQLSDWYRGTGEKREVPGATPGRDAGGGGRREGEGGGGGEKGRGKRKGGEWRGGERAGRRERRGQEKKRGDE